MPFAVWKRQMALDLFAFILHFAKTQALCVSLVKSNCKRHFQEQSTCYSFQTMIREKCPSFLNTLLCSISDILEKMTTFGLGHHQVVAEERSTKVKNNFLVCPAIMAGDESRHLPCKMDANVNHHLFKTLLKRLKVHERPLSDFPARSLR